eukprot:scaffold231026_cov38-Prasinocladus_malaysianus.AAC.1
MVPRHRCKAVLVRVATRHTGTRTGTRVWEILQLLTSFLRWDGSFSIVRYVMSKRGVRGPTSNPSNGVVATVRTRHGVFRVSSLVCARRTMRVLTVDS